MAGLTKWLKVTNVKTESPVFPNCLDMVYLGGRGSTIPTEGVSAEKLTSQFPPGGGHVELADWVISA
jgi:hypothetical protein